MYLAPSITASEMSRIHPLTHSSPFPSPSALPHLSLSFFPLPRTLTPLSHHRYQYTRHFETPDPLLPSTWIVIRIDGRGFHKLSKRFNWTKPNDKRAIELANEAAKCTIREVREVVLAYGQSDEFSFVFPPSTTLFDRRASKLTSTIVSTFTAHYIHLWPL